MADPFSDAYSFLAPNPNTEYGTYLPIARDTQTGANRWAMPELLRSALQGLVGMGQSTQTGSLTPEALATLTLGSMGAGYMGAPRGALAAGGAKLPSMTSPPTLDEFKQMINRGRMRMSADDTVKPKASDLEKAGSPLDFGRLYKYSEDDIAHFYNRSFGGMTEPAYKTYLRSLERAAFPPAENPIPYPTPGGSGEGKKIYGIAAPLPVGTPGFGVSQSQEQPPQQIGFRIAKDMVF